MKINIGIPVDLNKLLETRLLIQAGSGGGKSGTIRKLLEEVSGKVQVIALDIEGELVTIREKYDFALLGKDGDIPLSVRYADILAHKLLETNISAVIDLYELKHNDRIEFVKKFLESMINAPKNLWHDCIIVIDEAHLFCSEKNKEESKLAVIDLLTRGRKRGFCGVLATQRLSKLNKDAAAECYNKLIGKTGLDIDQKRAGEELGFTTKEEIRNLRNLKRQEFYAFGNAISDEVKFFRVNDCKTKFPERGKVLTTPPTPGAIKKILSKLEDIPKEAEAEIRTKAELENKIRTLTSELNQVKKGTITNDKLIEVQNKANENALINAAKIYKKFMEDLYNLVKAGITKRDNEINRLKNHIERSKDYIAGFDFTDIPIVEFPSIDVNGELLNKPVNNLSQSVQTDKKPVYTMTQAEKPAYKPSYDGKNTGLKPGEKLVLNVIAQYDGAEDDSIAVLTGYKKTSRYEYIRSLKAKGYCTESGGKYFATSEGIEILGNDFEPLPKGYDLQQYWLKRLQGGELALFRILLDAFPNSKSKQDLIEESIYKGTSVYEYCRKLQSRKIIINENGNYKVSANLF
jgi:hypothetical protein